MCKFVYIVRTDQNPLGICQPFSIFIHIMMTASAAASRATCALISLLFYGALYLRICLSCLAHHVTKVFGE